MILYSIIPVEVVFNHQEEPLNRYKEIEYMGEKLEVMPLENNQFVISRILSTSPSVYLNPKLQPGTMISGNLIS